VAKRNAGNFPYIVVRLTGNFILDHEEKENLSTVNRNDTDEYKLFTCQIKLAKKDTIGSERSTEQNI
jgi:hypothetical protein